MLMKRYTYGLRFGLEEEVRDSVREGPEVGRQAKSDRCNDAFKMFVRLTAAVYHEQKTTSCF